MAATSLERFGAALSDRANPIIVKELRQGLRTRTFWLFFSLMLVGCFVISVVAFASTEAELVTSTGAGFFYAYFFGLSIVQFFIIPYTAFRSLAREREDETWVLLSLTGLGAKRILRGKVGSHLVQALLYGSVAGPFMLFSYYLNGIDLVTIVIVVALGLVWMVFLTCVACCAATLADTRVGRALVHFVVLGGLLMATSFALSMAGAMVLGNRGGWGSLTDRDTQIGVAVCTWLCVGLAGVLYQVAAARLALPTEDYAKGPRIAIALFVIGSFGCFVWVWLDAHREAGVAVAAQLSLCAFLFVCGLGSIGEPTAIHPVHLARRGLSVLRPGPRNGLRFVLLLTGVLSAGAMALVAYSKGVGSSRQDHAPTAVLVTLAFVAIYLSLPVVLAHGLQLRPLTSPAGLRAFGLALVMLASLGPVLVALVLREKAEEEILNLFNPIVGPYVAMEGEIGTGSTGGLWVGILCAVGLLLAIVADRLLARAEMPITRVPAKPEPTVALPTP